jgi:hypothetical protein
MNKLLDPKSHKKQLNNCYTAFDPKWQQHIGQDSWMHSFKYHLEEIGGVRIDFRLIKKDTGWYYDITTMELVDEPLYTMWLLRWA